VRRFPAFTPEQRRQLVAARRNDVRRVIVVDVMLVVALALGFGYGLQRVSDASTRADSAGKAVAAINRQRSTDAKETAHKAAVTAYATCRRQQEQQPVSREFFHFLKDVAAAVQEDPSLRVEYQNLHHDLQARGLLEIPKCQKPPKGTP